MPYRVEYATYYIDFDTRRYTIAVERYVIATLMTLRYWLSHDDTTQGGYYYTARGAKARYDISFTLMRHTVNSIQRLMALSDRCHQSSTA